MRNFLTRKLNAVLVTPNVHATADTAELIDALVAAAPPEEAVLRTWVHAQFDNAVRAIQKDPNVITSLASGEMGLLEAAAANDHHTAAAEAMFHTINGHHRELRAVASAAADEPPPSSPVTAASDDEPPALTDDRLHVDDVAEAADGAWVQVTSDASALRAYAEAATQIGQREWVRQGIDWMASTATTFFAGDGKATDPHLVRLARRDASKLSYATRGGPLPAEEEAVVCAAALAECHPYVHDGRRVRLLDVGACGTLFDQFTTIDDTPIDLCPQADNPRVLQCDFLTVGVSEPGSVPLIEPSDDFPGGCLRSLPGASYDVVAMSLVLSYLPQPRQRGAMIRKARRMLRTPERLVLPPAPSGEGATLGGASRGLLLLVDTMSIDGRKSNRQNGGYIQQWIEAVESEGFAFIRHQVLSRSHALVFATAPMPTAETLAREPPELRMRREERADGWDHANEQSRGRKATAATPPGAGPQVTPPPRSG